MTGARKEDSTSGKGSATDGLAGDGWRRIVQRLLVIGIVAVVIVVAVVYFAYRSTTVPDPNSAFQTQSSYVYYANGKSQLGQFAIQNREDVPLSKISKPMQNAAIAAEDHTFWSNQGIDIKGIVRAAFSNAQGNATQGASTITQEFVKILYLDAASGHLSFADKIREIFVSLKIHNKMSKQTILQGYLNAIYLGNGSYGVQAAAQRYFGENASQLKPAQAAMLAAIINEPSYLNPYGDKNQRQALLDRYDYVLSWMEKRGTIGANQVARIQNHLPKVIKEKNRNLYGGQRGFALTMVKNALLKLGFTEAQIEGGGLRVTTTLNRQVMSADRNAVLSKEPQGLPELHAGVASVNNKSGALMGFYAGQNFLKSEINWATSKEQPGSGFKPFALAAALTAGWTLSNTFDGNSPLILADGTPIHNEGEASGITNGQSYGSAVSLLTGLEQSINTVYVDMTQSTPNGPERIKKTAIKMGIPKDTPGLYPGMAIALGSDSVSPIDMANSYATIANHGIAHPWYMISKVTDAQGNVLWKHHKDTHRAISAAVASNVSYAMQKVVQAGTGINAQALGRPAAGKTGTSTNANGDVITAWFSGFTPQVSTSVVYIRGNGQQTLQGYMPSYFGADYPTYTWTAAMQSIMSMFPYASFPPPAPLTEHAPTSGHAPYVPPPPPPPSTHAPAPAPQPSPSKHHAPKPKPKPAPKPTHHPTAQPPSGGTGGGGGGGGKGGKKPGHH